MIGLGPAMKELEERRRHFVEEEGPWNNGGKQACCESFGIAMTHDELARSIGDVHQRILDAGFVMVPKQWFDRVTLTLEKRSKPDG